MLKRAAMALVKNPLAITLCLEVMALLVREKIHSQLTNAETISILFIQGGAANNPVIYH